MKKKRCNPQIGNGSNFPKIFRMICDEPWFSYIRQGIKPVEGRKNTPKHQKIQVGDFIDFSNKEETFLAIVTDIRLYATLEDYLNSVTFQKALPGISSFEEAINIYYQWSTPEEIRKYGFLGIFITPLDAHELEKYEAAGKVSQLTQNRFSENSLGTNYRYAKSFDTSLF